jgi:hypothetical protein
MFACMTFRILKGNQAPLVLLRRLGYAPYTNRQGEQSFVKRIHGAEFPRFHLYINKEDDTTLFCSLHLDQKRPVYKGSTAHGGDYDSPEVAEEAGRLQSS